MTLLETVPTDIWITIFECVAVHSPDALLPLSRSSAGLRSIYHENERRFLRIGLLNQVETLRNFESSVILAHKDYFPDSFPSKTAPAKDTTLTPPDIALLRHAFIDSLQIRRFARFLDAKRRIFLKFRHPSVYHSLRLYHVPELPFNTDKPAPSLAEWIGHIYQFGLVPPHLCHDDTIPETLRHVLDWFLRLRRGLARVGVVKCPRTGVSIFVETQKQPWQQGMRDWRFIAKCHYATSHDDDILERWEVEAGKELGPHWAEKGSNDREVVALQERDWAEVNGLYQGWETRYFGMVSDKSQAILERQVELGEREREREREYRMSLRV